MIINTRLHLIKILWKMINIKCSAGLHQWLFVLFLGIEITNIKIVAQEHSKIIGPDQGSERFLYNFIKDLHIYSIYIKGRGGSKQAKRGE